MMKNILYILMMLPAFLFGQAGTETLDKAYDYIEGDSAIIRIDSAEGQKGGLRFRLIGGNNLSIENEDGIFASFQESSGRTLIGGNGTADAQLTLQNNATTTIPLMTQKGANGTTYGKFYWDNQSFWLGMGSARSSPAPQYTFALGYEVLNSAILTGKENIMLGTTAGKGVTSGFGNIGFGRSVFNGTTTGNQNISIGRDLMFSGVTGAYNIALGRLVFRNGALSGQYNSGIGSESLRYLTSGNYNFAGGYRSLFALTTGLNNVAIGNDIALTSTDIDYSILLGNQAGDSLAVDYAIAAGREVLGQHTTGLAPISIGNFSGYSSKTTNNATIIGHFAGAWQVKGDNKSAIGHHAGNNDVVGSKNTSLGAYAFSGTVDSTVTYTVSSYTGNTFTLSAPHGLSSGEVIACRFSAGAPSVIAPATGLTTNNVYAFRAQSTNQLVSYATPSAGTTVPLDLVLQKKIYNSTAVGYNAMPDQNNQVVLGDASTVAQVRAGNYRFNVDQTVGAAQDGYTLTYNHAGGEIELRKPVDLSRQNASYYEETVRQYTLGSGADTIITVDTLTLAIKTDSISASAGLIENMKSDTVRWQVRYDFYYLSDEDACFALLDLTTDGTETPAAIPGSAARGEQVSLNGGQMPGRTCLVDVPPGQKIRLCVKGNVGVATSMDISYLTISINEVNR